MTKVFFHAQPKNALWLRFEAPRIQKVAAVTPHSYYTKQQPVCVCVCASVCILQPVAIKKPYPLL